MRKDTRSTCPINLSLEIFGDRWTLLVLRDVIFTGARHFRELLASPERISSNVLADRLAVLVEHGLLTKADDPSHKRPPMWDALMDELRETRLGPQARLRPAPDGPTVAAQMQAACAAVLNRTADTSPSRQNCAIKPAST